MATSCSYRPATTECSYSEFPNDGLRQMTTQTDDKIGMPLDLVWGIKAIAKVIGRSERQTYSMLVAGQLPARRVGQRWVAKRETIERFFAELAA